MSETITKTEKAGRMAAFGSLGAAILSSTCCWLPLLMISLGATTLSAGAFLESYRPFFLGLAAVFLSLSFYLLYLRRPKCQEGSACAAGISRTKRVSRGMFWLSLFFVLAFAFFPNYVGALLGGTGKGSMVAAPAESQELWLDIEGMTCEGCAANIHKALVALPGVLGAEVDFETKKAKVLTKPAYDLAPILEAVKAAGYEARLQGKAGTTTRLQKKGAK